MPGIVTTPTMPVGPTSSLMAIVPVEWTSTGFKPTGANARAGQFAVAPGASEPVTSTVFLVAETAVALKCSVAPEVFIRARPWGATLLTGVWVVVPGAGTIHSSFDDVVESPSKAPAMPACGDWAVAGAATTRLTTTPGPPVASMRAE